MILPSLRVTRLFPSILSRRCGSLEHNLCDATCQAGEGVAVVLAVYPHREGGVDPFPFAGDFPDDDVGAGIAVFEGVVPAELDGSVFSVQEHGHVGGAHVRIDGNGLHVTETLHHLVIPHEFFDGPVANVSE